MPTTLPAEWAPQAAVMLTWPRADGDFAGTFESVEKNFIGLAAAIARFEPVLINHEQDPAALGTRLAQAGVPAAALKVLPVPSDDAWARDHGPITVFRDDRAVHLDFTFNGWGGKFASTLDNLVSQRMAMLGALPYPIESVELVLEGGAIDSDGEGTLLTTENCLLAPTRNPTLEKPQVEEALKAHLGLARVLWLSRGGLAGDDTDSHVDTLARFCDAETIAYQGCDDRTDAHFAELEAMAGELAGFRTLGGDPYELVPLPLPAAIHDGDGKRLPASYANFLVINGAVLVPTYGDPADAVALERLGKCFPDREVIGIDCRALITQYGSLHCVTMQIPSFVPSPRLRGEG